MSSEKCVYLVKDLFFQVPSTSTPVKDVLITEEVNLNRYPELVDDSSVVAAINGFIQQLQRKDGILMMLTQLIIDSREEHSLPPILFRADLKRIDVERLCEILNKPFLEIKCRLKSVPQLPTMHEKRLELSKILANSQVEGQWFRSELFATAWELLTTENVEFDIILGWKDAPQIIQGNETSLFQNLFGKETSKHVTLVAGNGAELKCHRVVLEAHSNVLATMAWQWPWPWRIEMTDFSEECLSQLVRYLYCLELNSNNELTCKVALELFKFSEKYMLTELQNSLDKFFLGKKKDWFGPDELLDLYLSLLEGSLKDKFKPLEEHLLNIMISLSEEIQACERFQTLQRNDSQAAMALVWKLLHASGRQLNQVAKRPRMSI